MGGCIFEGTIDLKGDEAFDVVLRPNPALAATTIDITRLLDHEFVFTNVPVQ
jgi:hypothetical protein